MIELLSEHGDEILRGLLATIMIVSCGFFAGALLGLALSSLLVSSQKALRWPARTFVELIRNTPFLIQAMLLFALFGVLRLRIDPLLLGGAAVAIYTSAYMAEIVRGALKSVAPGQRDAARALGLKPLQSFRLIVFPQLLPAIIPASANLLGTVAKESAFLSAVSVAELTFAGQVVIAQTFKVFEVWAIVGILYLAIVLSILAAAGHFERRLQWSARS